jgi:uncharacterized membrane protein/protein-disulfide isomerase
MHFAPSADSHIKPLPFRFYFWVVVFLAGLGLTASIYLSISHFRVYTDIGYRSFCAISRAINCDTVSLSPYSILLNVPVPVWGIVGYSLFLLLVIAFPGRSEDKYRIWTILFLLAMAFSIYSAVLAFISSYYIGSYCIVCIATYAVNFLLAYFCWLIKKRLDPVRLGQGLKADLVYLWQKRSQSLLTAVTVIVLTISLLFLFPDYWNLRLPEQTNQLSTGYTEDGHPWIGSNSPELVITEYTDYLCFQCKKMHFYLRELMNRHPDKIRLIHRHFPMDSRFNPIVKMPFHEGSGVLALLAIYSGQNGKFWQANDYIYNTVGKAKQFDLHKMAHTVGLDFDGLRDASRDQSIRLKLKSDIWQGLKSGITGTPVYVINDKLYQAEIPAEVLKTVLE